jgi:hypothetical protein
MITRQEVVDWINSPVTKGLYEIYKSERLAAEDNAFSASVESLNKGLLLERSYSEVLQYARLEVINHTLSNVFYPLYDCVEKLKQDEEKSEKDAITTFIKNIEEVKKYAK